MKIDAETDLNELFYFQEDDAATMYRAISTR